MARQSSLTKNRYVNTKYWRDDYIMDLDPTEKLIFIYCLTSPESHISGSYEISLKLMAMDTGIDKDMIVKIFDRFEKDNKIIYSHGWVTIANFEKHQKANPKMQIAIDEGKEARPPEHKAWAKYLETKQEQRVKKAFNE